MIGICGGHRVSDLGDVLVNEEETCLFGFSECDYTSETKKLLHLIIIAVLTIIQTLFKSNISIFNFVIIT